MISCVDAWRLVSRPGHPDFLDLPWSQRLTAWAPDLTVEVVRGTHRHVVKFVAAGDGVYALKELPGRLALREYRLLREMDEAEIPVVEAVGVVERPGSTTSSSRGTSTFHFLIAWCSPTGATSTTPTASPASCWTGWRCCSCGCTSPGSSGVTAR